MKTILDKIEDWERDSEGDVIFKGTKDAISYATLIYTLPDKVQEIRDLRAKLLKKIADYRKGVNIDFDRLFELACQAQFYRECFEDCDRLRHLVYLMNQDV